MVDRTRKWLSVEVLEDRTLPSAAPTAMIFDSARAPLQSPANAQAAPLFIGGALAVADQANGAIVGVGEAATAPSGGGGSTTTGSAAAGALALARVTPAGQLDPSFGTGGEVWTSISAMTGETCSLSVQADGEIVLTVTLQGATGITVARFNPDGSPDVTFATNGETSISLKAITDVTSFGQEVTGSIVYCDDANSICITSGAVTITLNSSTPPSVFIVPATPGSVSTQLPWSGGGTLGPSGGILMIGRASLFVPASHLPFHASDVRSTTDSPQTTVLVQIPWSRASDSLLVWNESTTTTESPPVPIVVVSFEGAGMPSYMQDSPLDTTYILAALPPSESSLPDGLALSANAGGLPAYLIQAEAAALASTRRTGHPASANDTQDAGLAAVDAAFALAGSGEKVAADLSTRALPPDTEEQEPPQRRGVSWPMWFVLLVAASGGGAAWQGAVQYLPGRRSRHCLRE